MSQEKLVEDHRLMVTMTGNLSDFQLNNLQQWPKVVIDSKYIETITVNYDFTKLNEDEEEELHSGKVVYDFTFNQKLPYPKEELDKRVQSLINWTKYLFWEDTVVEIKKKGKKWQNWKI